MRIGGRPGVAGRADRKLRRAAGTGLGQEQQFHSTAEYICAEYLSSSNYSLCSRTADHTYTYTVNGFRPILEPCQAWFTSI
jgi:hypothetical protein